MEYKERVYQWADGIIDDLLVFPELELDVKDNCVAYQDIVDKIVECPKILERCESLPLSKDPVLVYEAILRNPRVKDFSKLYQNNPLMQFYISRTEKTIEKLGKTIISAYTAIYFASNFDRFNLTSEKMLDLQKSENKKLGSMWKASFREDRPVCGYYPKRDGTFKIVDISDSDNVFGEKSIDDFYDYVDRKKIDVSPWGVKITKQTTDDFNKIYFEHSREELYRKLPEVIESDFDEIITKQKIDHLIDGGLEDFIEDIERGQI